MSRKNKHKNKNVLKRTNVQSTHDTHSSPDAVAERIIQLNSEGIVTYSSPNPEQNNYCPADDLNDLPIENILPPDVARRFREKLDIARETGHPQLVRYQQPIEDTVRFFEARIFPCTNGNFEVSVQTFPDDTPTPEQPDDPVNINFQTLVSRLPGALYRCTPDQVWRVFYVSAGIEEFLGYPAADFMQPDGITFFDVIYEPDRPYVRHLVEQAALRNAQFTIEYRMIHADGSLRWVNEQGQTVLNENAEPAYLEGIIMDVTESYRQRENSSAQSAQLSSISTLGAGVAHEINNALAIMMANLDYAVEELDNIIELTTDDQRLSPPLNDIAHSLSKLDQGMTRVQKIVRDLRSYSDLADENHTEAIDIPRLIEWAIREASSLQIHTKIQCCFPEDPVFIFGNQLGLLQVFTHLLVNAEKSFAANQQVDNIISISLKHIDHKAVLIEIQDNGIGIPPDTLPHVFEPFFSTRPIGEGTGLGLFVCQGIVHSMNGEIMISSTPNQGTTVQLILPQTPLTSH